MLDPAIYGYGRGDAMCRMGVWMRLYTPLAGLLFLVACAEGEEPGHYWSITAVGIADECTSGEPKFQEKFDYRVMIEGNNLELAIGPDVFATGSAEGCNFNYESVIWADDRDGHEIRWQILGGATANVGDGAGCPMVACEDDSVDWCGIEYFTVISSEDPDVQPGCSYDLQLTGKYLKEVK